MAVYTEKKTYHTKAHMGMIDVTEDFQHAVEEACRQHGISAGTVTGFTTGGVAGLTTLEFEPGIVNLQSFSFTKFQNYARSLRQANNLTDTAAFDSVLHQQFINRSAAAQGFCYRIASGKNFFRHSSS